MTIEKFQNLQRFVPAATLAPPYEAPGGLYACQDNASLDRCGCCAEDEIVAVARGDAVAPPAPAWQSRSYLSQAH